MHLHHVPSHMCHVNDKYDMISYRIISYHTYLISISYDSLGTILGPHHEPHAKKHVYQGGDVFLSLASFLYHALNERFHFGM